MDALRQMCDPLLAGRANSTIVKNYPKLLGGKHEAASLNNLEVPADLLAPKPNYSLMK